MKITHNKVGQNLNVSDSGKKEKTDKTSAASAEAKKNSNLSRNDDAASNIGAQATKVDLSPRAQEAKRIKELAMAAPDVDEAKVAKFQKLIDEKKYNVDAKKVADKLVDEHLETAE